MARQRPAVSSGPGDIGPQFPWGPVTAEQTAAVLWAEVASAPSCSSPGPGTTLEQITKEAALQMLHQCGGNRTQAALHLGIGRTTLWRILRK